MYITRRNDLFACDILFAGVPAIDDGSNIAVIVVGPDIQLLISMRTNLINNLLTHWKIT